MKIYCNIDVDQRKFEGRTQLAAKMLHYLREQGYEFVKDVGEANLIHFHSSGVLDSRQAWKLSKKYKIPVIYSLYSNSQTSWLMHPVNFFIQKVYLQKTATQFLASYSSALPLKWRGVFLKKLNRVVVPSLYLKKKLFENTVAIPFGTNTVKFKPMVKEGDGRVKVGYFGHASVFKGLNDFVKASKKFDLDIETHIFMTERFDKVDRYIQKRNPKIIIHGFEEDIVKAYNEMDIIVLPYRMEIGTVANPLVLLEAMACGRAIVSTDFKFVQEIVGDSALIVKKYSPKLVSKAVNLLAIKENLRIDLGRKARARVTERYSLRGMLESYHKLYQEYE